MTSLEERLADSATRQHAIEVMLLAHVVLDRTCLDGRTAPMLSRTGRRALEFILDTPPSCPMSPEVCCLYYADIADALLEPIVSMVEEAVTVTVGKLAFLSRETVLRSVGSVRREGVEFKPATQGEPPWKRRRKSA